MATAQAESTIPTGIWRSDPVHSTVEFSVRHAVGTFRGSFREFEAVLDGSDEPKLTGHVPVESVIAEATVREPSHAGSAASAADR